MQPTLTERYELRGLVGEGGMGTVYRAWDRELEEEIAIKVLQRSLTLSQTDIKRLKREIKTARRISHPNVIRIHDFGLGQREAFISMELLRGGTLSELEKEGRIPFDQAARIALQICSGIAAAHEAGVIHRDVKPHNVMFDRDGRVKLLDFGIARLATADTITQGVLGTPHYMSPEQADGIDVDACSDVYSVGVLLYELFAGRLPFESDKLTRLLAMHVNDTPVSPRQIDPEIPTAVEAVIVRCMEKDPGRRYANGRELADALRDALEEVGVASEPEPVTLVPTLRRRRRRRRVARVALPAALIAAAVVALTWDQARRARAPVTSASPVTSPTALAETRAPSTTPSPPSTSALAAATAEASPLPVARPGLLAFMPLPFAKTVEVDGRAMERSSRKYYAELSPGWHRVVTVSDRYGRVEFRVQVRPGETTVYKGLLQCRKAKTNESLSGVSREAASVWLDRADPDAPGC